MFRTSASENASPLLGVPGEELQQSSLDVRGETRRLEKPEGLRHPGLFLPNTCRGDLMSRRTSQHKNASSGSCTTMRHSSLSSSPSCVALGGRICWPQRRPLIRMLLGYFSTALTAGLVNSLEDCRSRSSGRMDSLSRIDRAAAVEVQASTSRMMHGLKA